MEYNFEIKAHSLVLTFSGDLIGEQNGPEIIEKVNDHLMTNKVVYAMVDISKIRYINSSGIGVLITILTKFRNKGGEMYLINPSDHVRKLLIITKLQSIFTICESIEEAFQRIK